MHQNLFSMRISSDNAGSRGSPTVSLFRGGVSYYLKHREVRRKIFFPNRVHIFDAIRFPIIRETESSMMNISPNWQLTLPKGEPLVAPEEIEPEKHCDISTFGDIV